MIRSCPIEDASLPVQDPAGMRPSLTGSNATSLPARLATTEALNEPASRRFAEKTGLAICALESPDERERSS